MDDFIRSLLNRNEEKRRTRPYSGQSILRFFCANLMHKYKKSLDFSDIDKTKKH